MAASISISNFSSLYFETAVKDKINYLPHDYWKLGTQTDVDYTQWFLPSDTIRVQYTISINPTRISLVLKNRCTNTETTITPVMIDASEEDGNTYIFTLSNLAEGKYTVSVRDLGDSIWESHFGIAEELPDTLLLNYANYRNEFDVFFEGIDFDFRVPAGFLPFEVNPLVDASIFRDQRYAAKLLSAFPYEKHTLTICGDRGVPNWMGQKLNLIFSTSAVSIDGHPYVRSDGSEIQAIQIHADYPLFIYKIALEPLDIYSKSTPSDIAFKIKFTDNSSLNLPIGNSLITVRSGERELKRTYTNAVGEAIVRVSVSESEFNDLKIFGTILSNLIQAPSVTVDYNTALHDGVDVAITAPKNITLRFYPPGVALSEDGGVVYMDVLAIDALGWSIGISDFNADIIESITPDRGTGTETVSFKIKPNYFRESKHVDITATGANGAAVSSWIHQGPSSTNRWIYSEIWNYNDKYNY